MAADLKTASKDEIITMHAKIEELRVAMAARAHGGASVQGRWKQHDTARKVFIETVALPALRWGKLPPAADVKMLFLPSDDDIAGADKVDMDAWYNKHKKDTRSTSSVSHTAG